MKPILFKAESLDLQFTILVRYNAEIRVSHEHKWIILLFEKYKIIKFQLTFVNYTKFMFHVLYYIYISWKATRCWKSDICA